MCISTPRVVWKSRCCAGKNREVEHFAQHVIGERGVRYGQLVVVPANAERRHPNPDEPDGDAESFDT